MPDSLASQFEQRRPLLQHVADAVLAELEEALDDARIRTRVVFSVATACEFVDLAGRLQGDNRKPLVEVIQQITGRIQIETVEQSKVVEPLIDDVLSVVKRNWLQSQADGSPYLQLDCSIPPQAKPAGWDGRGDVPNLFRLIIECGLWAGEAAPTDDIERLELDVVDEDRALALIMKGGGVKGLAYAGALEQLRERYHFDWFVGTSAGAVAAVLLGAGYTPAELQAILRNKNFSDFFDAPWYKWLWNLVVHKGLHRAQTFTDWLDSLLAEKLGSRTRVRLSDLPNRVTVYASRRNMTALRFDSVDNNADAAYAVRCSMSIPFVFIPQSDQGFRTYDGGLQHNYPVDALLREHPDARFVSLYLGSEVYEPVKQRWVLADLLSIWTEASDPEAVMQYRDQTVVIDTRPVSTLDFRLSNDEKDFLLACGRAGAMRHLTGDSKLYQESRHARDELKAKVEKARTSRKRKRRIGWSVAIITITTLIAIWQVFW